MQHLVGKKKTNEKNMVHFHSLKEVIARKNCANEVLAITLQSFQLALSGSRG